ncbi:MAG: hypothetical protein PHQ83_12040 [Eubacteriales bacterium]|nr:hypothetical protein [Eubacteriales bacterium]
MNQYALLTLVVDDEIALTTYEIDAIEQLFTALELPNPDEKLVIKKDRASLIRLSVKGKKTKSRPDLNRVIHILGENGWEPFSVHTPSQTYYFRKLVKKQ